MSEGETILRINPHQGTIRVERKQDGITTHKEISNESLVECLSPNLRVPRVSSGLLPEHCISFMSNDNDGRYVCILYPERHADLSYYGTVYQDFPLPRLVFGFWLQQGQRVQSVNVGVVPEGRLRPDTPMYLWPFSNVNGFRMCIGNNVMPKCESLHTLSSLPYHIMSLPNNNDHYSPENNKPGLEYRDLLEYMRDKDPSVYYSEILMPGKQKLSDFIQR